MRQIKAANREQTHLLPMCVEDWLGPEHPARYIAMFVEQMDLKALEDALCAHLMERYRDWFGVSFEFVLFASAAGWGRVGGRTGKKARIY